MTSPERDDTTPKISYGPTAWKDSAVGGTAITSARLNNVETGLVTATTTIDAHDDRLDALEQAAIAFAQGATTVVTHGPTSARPSPALGTYFYDETLKQPIWGDGSAWRDGAGTTLGGAGSSNAPQNFSAVTQPDQSILCSWSAVAGASTYKLYEAQSPTGVAGATALTTTSSVRTPGTLRNYEYWVTATVSGVESAASNHGFASLPYVAPGGGTGGGGTGATGTPAQILNIGTGAGQNYFNEGIGFSTGHVDQTMASIINGSATNSPYFTPNAASNAVQFQVFANGATTSSNTHYPRSELRELLQDGTSKAAWNASTGTHILSGSTKVLHLPAHRPWACLAQMHDASSDCIMIMCDNGNGSSKVGGTQALWCKIMGSYTSTPLMSPYTIGTEFSWQFKLVNGVLTVSINGVVKFTDSSTFTSQTASDKYFKTGCYLQASSSYTADSSKWAVESPTDYGAIELRNLVVSHS